MDTPRTLDPLSADWVVLLLMVVLFTLTWINVASPKKWQLFSRSLFSVRLGRQSMRDDIDLQDRTLLGALVMSTAVIALFAYQVMVIQGVLPSGVGRWAELFGVALGVLLLQFLSVRLCTTLFQADNGLREYLYTLMLLHVVLGITLFPFTVLMAFPHRFEWRYWLALAGVVCIGLLVLLRWIRALIIGVSEGVSLRYIFVYLCAAEILPFALAIQQARGQFPHTLH